MARITALVLTLACATAIPVAGFVGAVPAQPPAAAPETPAAACARGFVAAMNDPTTKSVFDFENTWASAVRRGRATNEERVQRMQALHAEHGDLTVERTVSPDPLTLLVRSARGATAEFTFEMSKVEPGKLDGVMIAVGATGDRIALTPASRAEAVKGVGDKFRELYVFPDIGAKMADSIAAKLKAGDYDSITDEMALAARLTEDCRAVSKDLHLRVRFSPKAKDESPPHSDAGPSPDQRAEARRDNYAFRKVELLDGNIGYLRFDAFMEDEEANRVVDSAMGFLQHADAIIFDLRSNGGGSPEMIRYITTYLFESKTHLNDMVDRNGKVVEEYWTFEKAGAPGPRAGVPVYVLTSSRTFSGAEEFSYNLKNLKRGTIVGEVTGGGAHPVMGERVNDRFMVGVPFMRARNPISGTNWEGTGVKPDVEVPAADALNKAIELIRTAKSAAR